LGLYKSRDIVPVGDVFIDNRSVEFSINESYMDLTNVKLDNANEAIQRWQWQNRRGRSLSSKRKVSKGWNERSSTLSDERTKL